MRHEGNQNLSFVNMWGKVDDQIHTQVKEIWRTIGGLPENQVEERLKQLTYVVTDPTGKVQGISTAYKAYIKQLRSHMYAFRCLLIPESRIPGLTTKLVVLTRDFLESIHELDAVDRAIGVITIVENEKIKESRTEAIWPASKMVYIGNSKEGHHIRVYYFKGARILP